MPTPQDTPGSNVNLPPEESPSTRGAARQSRPNTALEKDTRRHSMLPQPKRTVSGVATVAAQVAMGSSISSGRTSRLGKASEDKPRWR